MWHSACKIDSLIHRGGKMIHIEKSLDKFIFTTFLLFFITSCGDKLKTVTGNDNTNHKESYALTGEIQKVIIESKEKSKFEFYFVESTTKKRFSLTTEVVEKYNLAKLINLGNIQVKLNDKTTASNNFDLYSLKANDISAIEPIISSDKKNLIQSLYQDTTSKIFKTAIVFLNYKNSKASLQPSDMTPENLQLLRSMFNDNTWGKVNLDITKDDLYTVNLESDFIETCDAQSNNTNYNYSKNYLDTIGVSPIYNRIITIIPNLKTSTCGWQGVATMSDIQNNQPGMILIRNMQISTIAHELGHSFGLSHSGIDYDKNGELNDADFPFSYADHSCIMGNGTTGTFNAVKLMKLGALNSETGLAPLKSGELDIVNLDAGPRINSGASTYFYAQYVISLRTPSNNNTINSYLLDSNYIGINIHVNTNSANPNIEEAPSLLVAVLKKGETWTEPINGEFSIKVLELDEISGTAKLDVKIENSDNCVINTTCAPKNIGEAWLLTQKNSSYGINYTTQVTTDAYFEVSRYQNSSKTKEKIVLNLVADKDNLFRLGKLFSLAILDNGAYYMKPDLELDTVWKFIGMATDFDAQSLQATVLKNDFSFDYLRNNVVITLYEGPVIGVPYTLAVGYQGHDQLLYAQKTLFRYKTF